MQLPGAAGRGRLCGRRRLSAVSEAGGGFPGQRAGTSGTPCLAGGAGLVRFPDGEGGAAAGLRAVQLRVLGGLERL